MKLNPSSESTRNEIPMAPPLPSSIQYFDDFEEIRHSVRNPVDSDTWIVSACGSKLPLDFTIYSAQLKPLVKSWCCHELQIHASSTAVSYFHGLRTILQSDIEWVVCSSPMTIKMVWKTLLGGGYFEHALRGMKSLLRYLSKFNLGNWTVRYEPYLASLPLPLTRPYISIESGEAILSVDEEAAMVGHFDEFCIALRDLPASITDRELILTASLICSYQFGLRPVQIGRIKMCDVQIWEELEDGFNPVHLNFKMAKQRTARAAYSMRRKVKHEWANVFSELFARGKAAGLGANDRMFRLASASATGQTIAAAAMKILPFRRTAMDFRHSAAQRLADAGASQEEVAQFLGHSLVQTSLVYFKSSPSQAERVNRALGISEIYQNVIKIARDKFIDEDTLKKLKGDQQIAAAPHGLPISGIGGCTTGQPICPYNPVTSCYGCKKFMPLHDVNVHKKVLSDFREIVKSFIEAARGELDSPAYQQLQRTLNHVQAVIAEIESTII